MDITTLFKACVKTVKATNKDLGVTSPKTNILKSSNRDVHLTKAREIVKQITSLQTFLLENKAAYLNVINYLSTNKTMTEMDREQVDLMAENIVSSCTNLINDYKKEIRGIHKSAQKEEHYQYVIESLESYLKAVSKIYTEAKAVRVKRVIDIHKLSKLETKPVNKESLNLSRLNNTSKDGSGDFTSSLKNKTPQTPSPLIDYDNGLSTEDMQMFEEENEHLFNELNNISDEVQHMEGKVVHIAELQQMFTEKVLQQEKDIERIADTVVGSTENIRDANKQIKQAIQRNAGLRVWVLFFLLVMSFSLLFLDWYND
ncbi:syntaxin-18 [Sitophilus oryzae]|uniref:Syntaxin-18 n=1 Tax=Sitophilus oryzae TaxID=7048 RepID=A0A6J2XM73_SITOR|nr:syntaxin-18 [Sitophilus oryzae]